MGGFDEERQRKPVSSSLIWFSISYSFRLIEHGAKPNRSIAVYLRGDETRRVRRPRQARQRGHPRRDTGPQDDSKLYGRAIKHPEERGDPGQS